MKFVEPRVGMVEVTFTLLVSVALMSGVLNPSAMETALTLKGVMQGSRVMVVVAMVSPVGRETVLVHVISVHNVFLVHCGKAPMFRLAIIMSKALQVSIDCI